MQPGYPSRNYGRFFGISQPLYRVDVRALWLGYGHCCLLLLLWPAPWRSAGTPAPLPLAAPPPSRESNTTQVQGVGVGASSSGTDTALEAALVPVLLRVDAVPVNVDLDEGRLLRARLQTEVAAPQ